jgi:thiol-disulfide isomerase/thioredoxin
VCFFSPLRAGEPIKDGVTPEANQLVKAVSDFHKSLQSASADIQMTITQEVPGEAKKEMVTKASFAAERPRHLKFVVEGDDSGVAIVCDGLTVWTYVPRLKQFTVDTAPMNLEILLRYHDLAAKAMAQMGPLCELFRKDPAALLLDPVTALKIGGTETIGGTECTCLHGEQEDMDWNAWFAKGDQPVLRRFTFSPIKGMLAHATDDEREKLKGVHLDVKLDYDWKMGSTAAPGTFAFQPPEGAQKMAQFMEPDPAEAAGAGLGSLEALKGKPAPDFTLNTLDGGKVHLADLKGKVVVLDFWATWCGPCRAALPLVNEAASSRKDKGVVFYAVNQQEDADQIRAFLKKADLNPPVALDAEGAAATLYGVQGIPQTVIIDKAGNIADIHVGYSPAIKETIGKQLDELLAK